MKTVKTTKSVRTLPLILIIALIMTLALPMSVFADTEKGKITIAPQSDSLVLKAEDFTAYKLFDLTIKGTGETASYGYEPVDGIEDFLEWAENELDTNPYGETPTEFREWLEKATGDDAMKKLKKLTKDLEDSKAFTAIVTAEQKGKKVEIDGLDYGYYLVTGKGDVDGQKVIAHSSLVNVDKAETEIVLKANAPGMTKTVSDEEFGIDKESTDHELTANIGDTVYFRLDTNVPDMTGYESYTFTIYDTMSKGLTFDEDSLVITLVNPDGKEGENPISLAVDTDFTLDKEDVFSGEGEGKELVGTTITIDFLKMLDYAAKKGWNIVITYSATLNEDAALAPQSNTNSVTLEYSNDPYADGSGTTIETETTPEEKVDVYTFEMQIEKIDGNSLDKLAGAVFQVRTEEGEEGSALKLKQLQAGDEDKPSIYIVDPVNGSTDIISPESGLIKVIGLADADYYLYEKTAPTGYNRLDDEIEVTLIDGVVNVSADAYAPVITTVENNAGTKLPSTGGIGTTGFYLISALLTLALAVFIIANKKRNLLKAK